MVLAFAGSFLVSSITVKRGVEEHLRIKNIDNANSLALAATQLAHDQSLIELLMSAQFDNGHYQYIRWVSPEGDILVDLEKSEIGGDAPQWFKKFVTIEAPNGTAQIQSGWKQLGSIQLQSAPAFAYQALWDNTVRLLVYFSAAIVLFGLIGHVLLTLITRSLHEVVVQARGLRQRRFTKVPLPSTREFRELAVSMNSLSDEVKHFFEAEASQLHRLQLENEIDKVSGTFSREYFLNGLNAVLVDTGMPSEGGLSLFRIHDLQGLNRTQGRTVIDMMLQQLGEVLNVICSEREHWSVGRLNGSDFAVLSPGAQAAGATAQDIFNAILAKLDELGLAGGVRMHGAAYQYHSGEALSQLLSRVDHALAVAETRSASTVEVADSEAAAATAQPVDYWRGLLAKVLDRQQAVVNYRPTISREQHLLHHRVAVEYQDSGQLVSHRLLQTWASRLGRSAELDSLILRKVIAESDRVDGVVAVALSPQSLLHGEPFQALLKLLEEADPMRLSLDIPEYVAMQDFGHFKHICDALQARRFQIGLVNVGQHLESIGQFYDCGVSYCVLDGPITLDIAESESHQVLVRSLATIFHSIGSKVLADGITNRQEWELLLKLGLDGGAGAYADEVVGEGRS